MNKYTFECTLCNQKQIEERFSVTIVAPGQSSAKDAIEQELHREWGSITKRVYQGERMKSERYWDIKLRQIEMTRQDDDWDPIGPER